MSNRQRMQTTRLRHFFPVRTGPERPVAAALARGTPPAHRHSSAQFQPDALRAMDKGRGLPSVHSVMNLSANTTRIAIGSSSLSSIVVSAVIGAPRGF